MNDPLSGFSEPVQVWFRETLGSPTAPQAQGWPPIQRGEHTLILAPTGSGKTIAAFLWGIDRIYQTLARPPAPARQDRARRTSQKLETRSKPEGGVQLLYISPLKALNNDIERNLRAPLEGIRAAAAQRGIALEPLRVAVRTGDTPAPVRAAMIARPPHILITTPESLYLVLTSPRAREVLRSVRSVIVDEIHTLCGTKRGVHLALSLERLEHLVGSPVQRIGLSATIRPLVEVARFLGGQVWVEAADGARNLMPRPVTIVDAGYKKSMSLQVVTVVEDFRDMPGDSIWPTLIPRVLQDIRDHTSTLIFANNRRLAERTADRLNAQLAADQLEVFPSGSPEALAPGGIPLGQGIFAIGAQGPIRAHHGSMSKEARHEMEQDLKAGRLPALVGTSSLELGIDIGAIDLVVQLQSPKSVAQGLQRVGRSGHLVGQTSVGRIYPTFREDLLEAAAIARGMLDGDVEPTYTPQNALDVLAQQIVAMVAMEDWNVPALYDLVRQAYPYGKLSFDALRLVVEMLNGRYHDMALGAHTPRASALRPRLALDRINDRLAALPGTRLLAVSNAGTITDRGVFGVYLNDGKTRLGELDEEFVFETRAGNTFLLGSNVWRVLEIADDRVIVADAAGETPRMPFWRGDYPYRPYELGLRIGRFRSQVAQRIRESSDEAGRQAIVEWLRREYALDLNSARNLVAHVARQLDAVGVISSDSTILVETFQDAVGDPRLVIHTPYGGRVNGAWALALTHALRERLHQEVETQVNDDGILFRFPSTTQDLPLDVIQDMTPAGARERILRELPDSAVFGAQFRMNAARALLLPRATGSKRTPFWLQRLKARDLLALVRQLDDFPLVVETYRDCLRDVLDLIHLEQVLARIQAGEIQLQFIETVVPSPVASSLLFNLISQYMYEWDAPRAERQLRDLALRREVLEDVLQGLEWKDVLRNEALAEVSQHVQHLASGYQARSLEELALYLDDLGDLTTAEIRARSAGDAQAWVQQLQAQHRVVPIRVPARLVAAERWTPHELADEYRAAFAQEPSTEAAGHILRRFLRNSGPLTRAAILDRYPFTDEWLDGALAELVISREVIQGHLTPAEIAPEEPSPPLEYCDRHNLDQIHHRTLAFLRKQVQPVALHAFADFLVRWQHVHPKERLQSPEGLAAVLGQMRGLPLPGTVWESAILPARLLDYAPWDLGLVAQSGEWIWVATGPDPRRARLRFLPRGQGSLFLPPPELDPLTPQAKTVYEYLKAEGASFLADLQTGLGLTRSIVRAALTELALAGLVTNDAVETMRFLLQGGFLEAVSEAHTPLSALEADLSKRFGTPRSRPARLRPSASQLREARSRVEQRLGKNKSAPDLAGRWSVIHRAAVLGPALSPVERGIGLAHTLLGRYGVITRQVLESEDVTSEWDLLYPTFQRMELRGELRRGYFVAGLAGIQYALPEAVEQLRAAAPPEDDELVLVNAVDPAFLRAAYAPASEPTPGAVPARVPSSHLVLWQGKPILVAEDNGERLTVPEGQPERVRRALSLYLGRPDAPRRIVVSQWNGAPVLGSPGASLLESLGLYRAPNGMEWWRNPR